MPHNFSQLGASAFRAQSTQLEELAAADSWRPILTESVAEAERVGAAFVSDGFFKILRAARVDPLVALRAE